MRNAPDQREEVVDACIGVKWLLKEPYTREARALLVRGATLIVPDIFHAEVANTLWKRTRYSAAAVRIDLARANSLLRLILGYSLTIEPSREHLLTAMALSE